MSAVDGRGRRLRAAEPVAGGRLLLAYLCAECGSPKYERAALRWLGRYLAEGSPTLRQFAEVTTDLAKLDTLSVEGGPHVVVSSTTMKRPPTDFELLKAIYERHRADFQARAAAGVTARVFVPIDIPSIAADLDVEPDNVFGRLYFQHARPCPQGHLCRVDGASLGSA